MELPLSPVQSVSSITIFEADGGGIEFDNGHYFADTISHPPRIVLHGTAPWPKPGRRANGIEIAVTAGFGDAPSDVPEPIRQALLLLVAHWFERREPVVLEDEPHEIPDTVSALLNSFKPGVRPRAHYARRDRRSRWVAGRLAGEVALISGAVRFLHHHL